MKQNNVFKKIWKSLYSMKFGIILLIIIGISSIAGTIIPQNNPLIFYEREYNPFIYTIINTLSLHKVFTSWWFIAMIMILSVNLTLCSIIRLPIILRQIAREPNMEEEVNRKSFLIRNEFNKKIDIEDFFRKRRFFKVKKIEGEEGVYYFSRKNTLGYLGSWLSHMGLVTIILFYIFGKIAGFETYIHGVSGTIHSIENTDYILRIDDFNIDFREDHTVKQYTSHITVEDEKGELIKTGDVMVNHPLRMKGINIYQNGTGWAIDMQLIENGEKITEEILHQGEVYVSEDRRIALQFVNFYPDFDFTHKMPRTISPYLNNPRLLYTLYYEGHRVDMNVVSMGDKIIWGGYIFKIDNPREFTLLQIVSDPGILGATVGGIILLLGIILAFYFHPKELKAVVCRDGKTIIWGDTAKNPDIFKEELELALAEIK